MSVVSWVLDRAFTLLMWMLLDPVGRQAFWVVEFLMLAVGITSMYFIFRKEK